MSIAFTIDVEGSAVADYGHVIANLSRPDLRKVMGRRIAREVRRHFTKLNRERPNQLGGKRTNFWAQLRRSVQQPELFGGDGIKIAITHVGAAQRYFGGEIEAKDGGKLTIPVHPDAHGKRAREFDDLSAIYFEDGTGVLVRKNSDAPGDIGEVFYRLVERVTQKADPTVLPPEEELQAAAFEAGDKYLTTLIARQRGDES